MSLYAPADGRPGWIKIEPEPDVRMDEFEAQRVLRQPCPACFAEPGFSCTVPVEIDFQPKRQQVLEFHRERAERAG